MPHDYKVVVKIGLDFFLLLTVGLCVVILHFYGKPTERGFNCDDDSIRYPYRNSTIPGNVLYIVGTFLPIIVICATELTNESRSKTKNRDNGYMLLGKHIPQVIWKAYKRIGVFLFGAFITQFTVDIAKYSIGRLRPHFLAVCQPNVTCTTRDPHEYITDFVCTGNNLNAIRELRLSFPSAHAVISAYSVVFTVIYLQACMGCRTNTLFKPFLQFILLMISWYTSLSRIADYKHHWSDVMIGYLQGALEAIIMTFFVSDFFNKEKEKDEDIRLQNIAIDASITSNKISESRVK